MPLSINTETLQIYLKDLGAAQQRSLPVDLQDQFLETYHRKNSEHSHSIQEVNESSIASKMVHMNHSMRV